MVILFSAVMILSLCTICSTTVRMEHQVKIIVIGAGAAGLAACNRLLEAGISEFLLLEARSRLGGRIHSVLNGTHFSLILLYSDMKLS